MSSRRVPDPLDYRRLFEALPIPMLVLDADLVMIAMNDAYLAVAGATREQLLGRTPMAAFPDNPDDPEATGVRNLTRSLHAVLETGRTDTMALQRYDVQTGPGGAFEERYWSPVNVPLLDSEGRVTSIVHRVEEVTEFVRLRGDGDRASAETRAGAELRTQVGRLEADLLARAAEVQEANQRLHDVIAELADVNTELAEATTALRQQQQAKDRFIATLSHELRNPLAAIRAALDLLSLDLPAGHPALGVLDRQIAALVRLTDDLLDSSRAHTGRLTIVRQPLDLREVVRTVTADLRPDFARGQRTLAVATPQEPVPVDGDQVRLAQLLGNLLNNAFAYTRPGATVTVSLTATSGRALLAVRDTGMGFDPADAEHLFEVFTRALPSGPAGAGFGPEGAAPGGMGLGLGLVRSIAELHGGSVSAHSEGPGTGAEFRVRLPLRAAPPPEGGQPAKDETGASGQAAGRPPRRVLVIEDNADLAASYRDLLERQGDQVMLARTGAEGLAAARAQPIDLVLCDIGLPDLDGREVARRLGQHPRRDRMRVVAVSGLSRQSDRERSLRAGFDAHLVKPVTVAELEAALAGWAPPLPAAGRSAAANKVAGCRARACTATVSWRPRAFRSPTCRTTWPRSPPWSGSTCASRPRKTSPPSARNWACTNWPSKTPCTSTSAPSSTATSPTCSSPPTR